MIGKSSIIWLIGWWPSLIFATDYSLSDNWAALPDKQDYADWTPTGLQDEQAISAADVFYIHPTTDIAGLKGNTELSNARVNKQTDELPVKYQASVFNGSCKIYAPRYRQAVLNNFFKKNTDAAKTAFDTAYQDVKAAFEYYLEHYNHGRPIIIAGHSQGTLHAIRLLQEFFDGKPLQQQLVQAYLIGYPVKESQFAFLKVSESATAVGGYISYNTFGMDAKIDFLTEYKNAVVVNPLNWTREPQFVSAATNAGSLSKKSDKLLPKLCGARCGNGVLLIQKPSDKSFTPMAFKNYHLYDYALFYLNIRQNIAERVQQYIKQQNP